MKTLKNLTIPELLLELLKEGKAGISIDEPIAINFLVIKLEKSAGLKFGRDQDKWVSWFCSDDSEFSNNEKELIQIVYRLVKAEKKFIPKIKNETL